MGLFAGHLSRVCPQIMAIVQKAERTLLMPAITEGANFPHLKLEYATLL